jgi:hypothetical protein
MDMREVDSCKPYAASDWCPVGADPILPLTKGTLSSIAQQGALRFLAQVDAWRGLRCPLQFLSIAPVGEGRAG